MRGVLFAACLLVGCGKVGVPSTDAGKRAEEPAQQVKPSPEVKQEVPVKPVPKKDEATKPKEPVRSPDPVKAQRQFTILLVGETDFKRTGDSILRNEGRQGKENWTTFTSDPTVVLMNEVEREFSQSELKALRKYGGKLCRIIGSADRIKPVAGKQIEVTLVRDWEERVVLSFPIQSADTLENIKRDDMVAADGLFESVRRFEGCRLVTFKTPASLSGGGSTHYDNFRAALSAP